MRVNAFYGIRENGPGPFGRIKSFLKDLRAKPVSDSELDMAFRQIESPVVEYADVLSGVRRECEERFSDIRTDGVRSALLLRKFVGRISASDFPSGDYSGAVVNYIMALKNSHEAPSLPLHRDAFVWERMMESLSR
jgi:hypothetical protein